MIAEMAQQTGAEVLARFVATNDGMADAIDEIARVDAQGSAWNVIGESPAGHVSLRSLAHHALWDSWIHERDILVPLGIPMTCEDDELVSCIRYAAAVNAAFATSANIDVAPVLSVDAHMPAVRVTVTIGASITVTEGLPDGDGDNTLRGSTADLIEALSVRAPLPLNTPGPWRVALQGLAAVFDAPVP